MKIYLVGGAVRDQLLNLSVHEKDWVVVGSTPEEMHALHFQPVGKEFPVFLHPDTKEEYALARTERKTGKGYKGFVFHTDPSVTLEQDLQRRDLTINAIAQDEHGNIIDPFHGQQDIKNKILRHVSDAFAEDPVRILRLARFAARFTEFSVDPNTNKLMQTMVENGEVDALVPERVWQEFEKALGYENPLRFFEILKNCGALQKLFPELLNKLPIELPENFNAFNKPVLFAILLNQLSLEQITVLCTRFRVPNDYSELAKLSVRLKNNFANLNAEPKLILDFILQADALRRGDRFHDLLSVYSVLEKNTETKIKLLLNAVDIIKNINLDELKQQNLPGPQFAEALYQLRLQKLKLLLPK